MPVPGDGTPEREILGELTADEIQEYDNINHELAGADRAFEIAMNYYMNKRSFFQRDVDELWRRLADRFDIEHLDDVKIERVRGTVRLVTLTEEEKKTPPYMRTYR